MKEVRINKIQGTGFYNLLINGQIAESNVPLSKIIKILETEERKETENHDANN
ncbi:hypothetical protein [Treponema sp.]|uniref:hypothetical protein n=1 Tax=Treponema sp. TaxID=166 RepID=UPI00388EABEC